MLGDDSAVGTGLRPSGRYVALEPDGLGRAGPGVWRCDTTSQNRGQTPLRSLLPQRCARREDSMLSSGDRRKRRSSDGSISKHFSARRFPPPRAAGPSCGDRETAHFIRCALNPWDRGQVAASKRWRGSAAGGAPPRRAAALFLRLRQVTRHRGKMNIMRLNAGPNLRVPGATRAYQQPDPLGARQAPPRWFPAKLSVLQGSRCARSTSVPRANGETRSRHQRRELHVPSPCPGPLSTVRTTDFLVSLHLLRERRKVAHAATSTGYWIFGRRDLTTFRSEYAQTPLRGGWRGSEPP
jgi:hypothetical protein